MRKIFAIVALLLAGFGSGCASTPFSEPDRYYVAADSAQRDEIRNMDAVSRGRIYAVNEGVDYVTVAGAMEDKTSRVRIGLLIWGERLGFPEMGELRTAYWEDLRAAFSLAGGRLESSENWVWALHVLSTYTPSTCIGFVGIAHGKVTDVHRDQGGQVDRIQVTTWDLAGLFNQVLTLELFDNQRMMRVSESHNVLGVVPVGFLMPGAQVEEYYFQTRQRIRGGQPDLSPGS